MYRSKHKFPTEDKRIFLFGKDATNVQVETLRSLNGLKDFFRTN